MGDIEEKDSPNHAHLMGLLDFVVQETGHI